MGLRRLVAAAVLVATVLVAAAAPSHATADTQLNRLIDGPFTGSGTLDFSNPSCGASGVQDYVYGTGRPPIRSGTVHVVVCTNTSVSPFTVQGTFV